MTAIRFKAVFTAFVALITTHAAAPRLDVPIVSADRNVQLTVQGDLGVDYTVEWSLNMAQWNLVASGVAVNGSLTVHHNASAYSTVFYRATSAVPPQTLRMFPERLNLNVNTDGPFVAFPGAETTAWSSSDTAVATVDTNGLVKALAKGSATITASKGGQTVTAAIRVYDTTGANPDKSSATLIAEAHARNEITDEQTLIYRAYAAFGDSRLPAQFQGAPSEGGDDLIAEIANRIDTLSAGAQQILRPFLLPPIYADSWYAKQLGLTPSPQGGAGGAAAATENPTTNCEANRLPQFYPVRTTAHFNIHYLKLGVPSFDRGAEQLANITAGLIESIYEKETDLLKRYPLPDTTQSCNGGDGAVDIYISTIASATLHAQAVPYQSGCAKTPSFILLNKTSSINHYAGQTVSPSEGAPLIKAVLAHEFMHVLQFAMDRRPDCEDTKWIDEATAQWAMDFVDGAANFEDGFDKQTSNFKRSGPFIVKYLLSEHTESIEKPGPGINPDQNGYADYIFFQFLARKYTPDTIKQIYDAMAGPTGQRSVEAIAAGLASRGGLKAVWPEFAKTLWNDYDAQLLDYWKSQDQYDLGLQYIYSPAATEFRHIAGERLKTIEVDQKGAGKAKFTLLKAAAHFGADYEIAPRSFYFDHLKFTDTTVHSALFFNPIAAIPPADREFMKVQAWTKIAGQWKGPEDWTGDSYKQFCLDKKDERLEEMLILVSNSEANRGAEKPFKIPQRFPMQVSVSNVGCWQWEGNASTVFSGSDGTVLNATATSVGFEVRTNIPGRIYFGSTSGNVTASQLTQLGPCTITATGAPEAITKSQNPDGVLDYGLDLDLGFSQVGDTPDRKITNLTGSTTLSTTTTVVCPEINQTTTDDQSWSWIALDTSSDFFVSADGQTIEGQITEVIPAGGTQKTTYKFTSKRE